jgi:hypothetical protein
MAQITFSEKELKAIIKESIREILGEETMKMKALLLPFVSQKEQKDIEKRYGKPSRKVAKSMEFRL